jgi:S1-C subfamily serine protease
LRTILAFILFSVPVLAQAVDAMYVKSIYGATVLLYAQDEQGSMRMRCTATAIEKTSSGYVFVTAAHCACEDDEEKKTVSPQKVYFFITGDQEGTKDFIRATPIGCGYRHRGDDFALFSVESKAEFDVIPIGQDPQLIAQVINIASPLGLGKQVMFGTVSSAILNRPAISDDINWEHAILLQMFGVNGGSSGSSLICTEQKAICGFVVGSIGGTTMVAMPVSRFKRFKEQLDGGQYKWWNADPDSAAPTPAAPKKKP